jgi:iron complex transport system substrate-binding protein
MQAASASASPPMRIVSLNMCTDQLLLSLADPEQIAGLSPYARDRNLSFMAAMADQHPIMSGGAEDVLDVAPDLVLTGQCGARATREMLRAKGLPLMEVDLPRSVEAGKQQIQKMGELLGHPDRALAAVARIDAAIGRTRAAALRAPLRVLSVSRRGWVPGSGALSSSILATAGLIDAAAELGIGSGGFASLEAIIATRPDLILVSGADEEPEDQGQAFLLHPALQRLCPLNQRIVMPERLTVCSGPMLADALDHLAEAIDHIER